MSAPTYHPMLALTLAAALTAGLGADETLVIAPGKTGGAWTLAGTELRAGPGGPELTLSAEAPGASSADLRLSFDGEAPAEASGRWKVEVKGEYHRSSDFRAGTGSASFRAPGTGLTLTPGPGAALVPDLPLGDLSLEFWLKPARADSGEIVFLWKAARRVGKATRAQQISCLFLRGRLTIGFIDFFSPPGGAPYTISLQGTSAIVPGAWSHHLVRFDSSTGLLEYLMNGEVEAVRYVTSTGRQAGDVYVPVPGASGRLELAHNYTGLMDEFSLSPSLRPSGAAPRYASAGGSAVSPAIDLGGTNGALLAIEPATREPGESAVHWSYRLADSAAGWTADEPAWVPFAPGSLPGKPRGRFIQLRAELYPDAAGESAPAVASIAVRHEPDRAPNPPRGVVASAGNGRIVVRWKKGSEPDLAGYMVYYGTAPGEYFGVGAAEGPSPVVVPDPDATSLALNGLANGTLYFIAVAAYDRADPPHIGDQSDELSARPSRVSP